MTIVQAADDDKMNVTYFPSLTRIPFMDYSDSYRQSVCVQQQAITNGTLPFRDALQGLQLYVILAKEPLGGLEKDGSISPDKPRLDVRILDELAARAGFSWKETYGVIPSELFNATMTFDDVLDWTIQSFDVSAAVWSQTRSRINRGAGFPQGHVDASIIMVGKEPQKDSRLNVWSFLQPFDVWVWVLILVTFFVCGLTYMWMENINEDSDRQELQNQPLETIFFASLTFIGDVKFAPSTNYARLFVISLGFWSLLVSQAYTANLASFLVMQNKPQWNVNTVADAVRLQIPMCAIRNAAPALLVQEQYPQAKIVMIDEIDRGYAPAYERLAKGDCRLVLTTVTEWEQDSRDPLINKNCDLNWVGRVYKFLPAGFATLSDSGILCTSLIRAVLNLHILEMEDDGFIQRETQKALEQEMPNPQDCSDGQDSSSENNGQGEDTQLTLQNMGGLFICLYSLVALTVLMALRHQRQRNHLRRQQEVVERAKQDLRLSGAEEYHEKRGDTKPANRYDEIEQPAMIPMAPSHTGDQQQLLQELATIKEMIAHLGKSKED